MAEQEGVIKYRLDYHSSPACTYPQLTELNAWRTILFHLGLIGQDALRYEGLAYGNLSFRLGNSQQFVISGSQTGGLSRLTIDHYSKVLCADTERNHIIAEGAIKPSSEALTHAAIYQADCRVQAVIHVHSPMIWHQSRALALPLIDAGIQYGTQAMATAVLNLFRKNRLNHQPIVVMLGHEDGIVAFGESIAEASQILIRALASAMELAD